ncbi:MAG: hypothetical protein K6G24_03200 [Lachnospiraceae bacterium]|nr:hypothetical protein [Lachnospiraceae bacterium]
MVAAQKDVSAIVAFVIKSLKQNAVKERKIEVNDKLLADIFRAETMGDFRAIIKKYSTDEILSVAAVPTIYHYYCQYFSCTGSAARTLEYLAGCKKMGKKRRCLI